MDWRVPGFQPNPRRMASGPNEETQLSTITRITLRTLAVGVGTAYFCSTIFLIFNAPSLSEVGMAFGWYASALAQFAVAIVLVGIGLGLFWISVARGRT